MGLRKLLPAVHKRSSPGISSPWKMGSLSAAVGMSSEHKTPHADPMELLCRARRTTGLAPSPARPLARVASGSGALAEGWQQRLRGLTPSTFLYITLKKKELITIVYCTSCDRITGWNSRSSYKVQVLQGLSFSKYFFVCFFSKDLFNYNLI